MSEGRIEYRALYEWMVNWLFSGFKPGDLTSRTDRAMRFKLNDEVCGAFCIVENGICTAAVGPVERVISILGGYASVCHDSVRLTLPTVREPVTWGGRIVRRQDPSQSFIIFRAGNDLGLYAMHSLFKTLRNYRVAPVGRNYRVAPVTEKRKRTRKADSREVVGVKSSDVAPVAAPVAGERKRTRKEVLEVKSSDVAPVVVHRQRTWEDDSLELLGFNSSDLAVFFDELADD